MNTRQLLLGILSLAVAGCGVGDSHEQISKEVVAVLEQAATAMEGI